MLTVKHNNVENKGISFLLSLLAWKFASSFCTPQLEEGNKNCKFTYFIKRKKKECC